MGSKSGRWYTPKFKFTVVLEAQEVRDDQGFRASFEVDPFRRDCLLDGLDQVALILHKVDEIEAYEEAAGK